MEEIKEEAKSKPKSAKKSDSKSVIINGQLHSEMKKYCMGSKRKIGGIIENLIRLYLSNPKETENLMDNLKEN